MGLKILLKNQVNLSFQSLIFVVSMKVEVDGFCVGRVIGAVKVP